MKKESQCKSYSLSSILLVSFLIPSLAFGAGAGIVVPPRVIVVFDSSSSMMLTPDGSALRNMEDPGGDYDSSNPSGQCDSKFCVAKKVMSSVLPNFTTDSRVGLAHYYQFINKYLTPNTQSTRCYYDAMYKAGQSPPGYSFLSATDLGASVTMFPTNLSGKCTNNAAHQYTATQTSAATTGTYRCADYTYQPSVTTRNYASTPPTGTANRVLGGGGTTAPSACSSNTNYPTRVGAPVQWNIPGSAATTGATGLTNPTSSYVRQAVGNTAVSCPAPVPFIAGAPSGPPTVSVKSYSSGTTTGRWEGMGSSNTECKTSAPCDLYSVSNTPTERSAQNSWVGLYTTAQFTPVSPYSPLSSQTDTDVGTVCTGNNCATGLTGTVASCIGTLGAPTLYDTGAYTWSNFGFPAPTAAPFPTSRPGGYTESTPGGSNPTCNATQPCYVTLMYEQPVSVPSTAFTVYNNSPGPGGGGAIPAGSTVTGPTNDPSGPYWMPAGACAATMSSITTGTGFLTGHQPAGCSAASNYDCRFTLVNSNFMTSTGCVGSVTRYDNTTPAACSALGTTFAYTGAAPGTVNTVQTLSPGSSCNSIGVAGTAIAAGTRGCPSGGSATCIISSISQSNGAATPSTPQYTNAPIPTGYSGAPTSANVGGQTLDPAKTNLFPAPSCPAAGTVVHSTTAAICGGGRTNCDVISAGAIPGIKIGENQTYSCAYQPVTWTWTAPSINCTIVYPSRVWTVPTSAPVCTYNRSQWSVTPPPTNQYRCRYQASYSRHNFVSSVQRFCEYYRMRTIYEYSTYQYTYRYQTKGGEFISYQNATPAWVNSITSNAAAASQLCNSGTYNDVTGFPGGDCPPTIDSCAGPGTFCNLRWGRPIAGTAGSGRYKWALSNDSTQCRATDQVTVAEGKIAAPTPASLVSTAFESVATPTLAETACTQSGAASQSEYRLISDWYDPSYTNNIAQTSSVPTYGNHNPPLVSGGTWSRGTPQWSNQTFKRSGMSVSISDGGFAASPILVPIPNTDAPAPSAAALSAALDQCELPSGSLPDGGSNVDPTTLAWANKGICIAHDNYKDIVGGKADFTPLYGSLINAKEYIDQLRAADDPGKNSCRKYYVVLATDGQEDTPSNNSTADLLSAVDSLCGSKDSSGKCMNASTYVVAFGSGAAAAVPVMDQMAAHGGTVSSYPSTDQLALQLALTNVFSTITAGEYTRSKPTLSTDGTRIYASSFAKCGGTLSVGLKGCVKSDGVTPDPKQNGMWKGFLNAYQLSTGGGAPSQKWEMSIKMNAQTSRNILTTPLGGCATPPCVGSAFTTGNAALLTALTTVSPTASQLPPSAVVNWLRNDSLTEPYYYDHTGPQPSTTALRTTRLADIQHSTAVMVAKSVFTPDWGGTSFTQQAEYRNFQNIVSSRPPRLLVGSNDGVLHGIIDRDPSANCSSDESLTNCPNGSEAWAWVPAEFVGNGPNSLHKQLIGHQLGVDGTPVVSDVCGTISGGVSSNAASCVAADWKTIAIVSLREGGTSLFGLQLDNAGGPPKYLWEFNRSLDTRLGQTWSFPVIGRVLAGSQEHFVAVLGAGRNMQANGSVALGGNSGEAMYVLDALTGRPVIPAYPRFDTPAGAEMAARPAMFRRPLNPFLDSVFTGSSDGKMYVQRFANPSGVQNGGSGGAWAPQIFFDPAAASDKYDLTGAVAKVQTVVRTPGWEVNVSASTPVTYALAQTASACGNAVLCPSGTTSLPLSVAPPIYNRAKAISSSAGTYSDYFVGTGDAVAVELASSSIQTNYFYALRDQNLQGAAHDGRVKFVVRMPHAYEQIVSEPVVIGGAVIVASYVPPQTGGCGNEGDTVLYAFDPANGDLTPAISDPNYPTTLPDGGIPDGGAAAGTGKQVPVRLIQGVGIPSDLLVIGDSLYFNTSAGGVQQVGVKPKPTAGDIRSFRKVR